MLTLVALLVIGGMTWHVLNSDERRAILRRARPAILGARAALRPGAEHPSIAALRARMPLPMVTFGIVALNVAIAVSMIVAPGSMSGADSLLRWGASMGPRTTNGEWTRLLTAMFVHAGIVQVAVNTAALARIGSVAERVAGPVAFAAAYLAAGLVASVVALRADPLAISWSASGAVAGAMGVFVASACWMRLRPGAIALPAASLRPLVPVVIVFCVFNLVSGALPIAAEAAGFATGFAIAAVAGSGAADRLMPARWVAGPLGAALVLALALAMPLRGITDAEPEIARLVETESRIAALYEKAVGQFRLGAMSAPQLARLIERSIVPQLAEVRTRVDALDRVPPAQATMLAAAREYLKLRHESWAMRWDALTKSNMVALRAADQRERESLRAFERLRPPGDS